MSIIKNFLIGTLACTSLNLTVLAQDPNVPDSFSYANKYFKPSLVPDGVIQRVDHQYKVTPWKAIRENDIAWWHRVWKQIPVHEKRNQAFLYQGDEFSNGGAFIEILNHLVRTKQIVAYSNADDRFTTPIDVQNFDQYLGIGTDTSWQYNPETEEEEPILIERTFNIETVTRYLVKEDWIFDRNSGRVHKYIVGIAPVMEVRNRATGEFEYFQVLYWIHYPSARQFLGQYEVYNPKNMVKRMTWADYLEGGYYSSVVYKYSKNNPRGENLYNISDMTQQQLRGLVEGQRVIEDLLNQEMDMWER